MGFHSEKPIDLFILFGYDLGSMEADLVKIMSHREAVKELKIASGEMAVICITDAGETPDPEITANALEVLHLDFMDSHFPRESVKVATKEDIIKAINFAKKHGDVLVCCHGGISRSSALAYIIECMEVHPAMAVNIWSKQRHHPNRLIVNLGEEILENPNIGKYYTKWMNS